MRENFTILKQRAALGATHVPVNSTMPCRDSGLPHDTRNITVLQETFFERLLAREDRPCNLRKFKEFGRDVVRNTMRLEIEMRRGPQISSIPVPRFKEMRERRSTGELILTMCGR